MVAQTPMMKQYQDIKKQYVDTILFFRLGDFYEMFSDDALLASRELEITLTGRDAGLEERVPMCGIPYHAAENYIARLIQKGYKVAICEQVEDPKLCKGIVKREVIRVITPGTALDTQLNHDAGNSYLAAIFLEPYALGLAFCDVSTGEFWLSQFNGTEAKIILREELLRLNPVEILIPEMKQETKPETQEGTLIGQEKWEFTHNHEELYRDILRCLDCTLVSPYQDDAFNYSNALQLIEHQVQDNLLRGNDSQLRRQAISAAGAILHYLRETQKASPQQIKNINLYYPEAYLALDSTTFRNLELTKTLRYGDKKGSLLDLLDKTKTACGARLLQQWLQKPLTDKTLVEKRLDAVEMLSQRWSERQKVRNNLEKVYDLERLMTRILYGRANPKELIAFKNTLAVLPELEQLFNSFRAVAYLAALGNELDLLEDVRQLLEKALEEDPPLNLKDGGVFRSGYNRQIDELREISINGKEWIARLESQEKEKTGIKSLKIGFNKVFGYYLEVTKANLNLVPAHFQRKQTLANGERYITEELVRLESQVLGAEEKLTSLEEEIYRQLLKELGQAAQRVQNTAHVLAQLDVLQSLAEVAVQNSYVRPQLLAKEKNLLEFTELRHPVVEKMLPEAAYVPNDLIMPEHTDFYIITGPNMGGKSTYCRSAAIAVIMAQIGSFVPAQKALISLRDRVFARVGASDDLRSGQSTFMVEMNEVANILNHATKYSLVILDEVGRGTSTYDGLSMAWAVSEYLIKHIAAQTLFATHYHELTRLSELYERVQNLSVSVQEKGDEIVFLHKIIPGAADKSYGIQVARLAGLPLSVIQRAQEILTFLEKEKATEKENDRETRHIHTSEIKKERQTEQEVQKYHFLAKTLLDIDLFAMTPLEALNILAQLQELVGDKTSN